MTGFEKKQLAQKLMREGDIRSYNEIRADMELIIWTAQFQGNHLLEALNHVHKAKIEDPWSNREE